MSKRFEWHSYYTKRVIDNKTNKIISIINTLNKQAQRIAELEEQLKNATKQVRKKVCEEIRSRFLATCEIEKGCDNASFSLEVLNRILDQIQDKGENK